VDPISRREFWDILSELHIDGVTILVSTAYMDEAERCSRVGLMYQGNIIREGPPAALRELVTGELLAVQASDLAAAEIIAGTVDGVVQVQVYGDRLHVFVDDRARRQSGLAEALQAGGLENVDVRPAVPHLEEAFISLVTGQGQGA
jgi:ABC-2 type transport system ATP-binding protein